MQNHINIGTKLAKFHETEGIAAKLCKNSEEITVLLKNKAKFAKLRETTAKSAKQG